MAVGPKSSKSQGLILASESLLAPSHPSTALYKEPLLHIRTGLPEPSLCVSLVWAATSVGAGDSWTHVWSFLFNYLLWHLTPTALSLSFPPQKTIFGMIVTSTTFGSHLGEEIEDKPVSIPHHP